MTRENWKATLQAWNQVLLRDLRFEDYQDSPEQLTLLDLSRKVVESGRLDYPPATREDIARAETRLNRRLPPSYRNFLLASNGFRLPGNLVPRLLPASEIDWLRVRRPDVIEDWKSTLQAAYEFEAKATRRPRWRRLPDPADDPFVKELQAALLISEMEAGGSAIYLLRQVYIAPEIEWEAWFFADWVPGVNRYRSFWHLMEAELKSYAVR